MQARQARAAGRSSTTPHPRTGRLPRRPCTGPLNTRLKPAYPLAHTVNQGAGQKTVISPLTGACLLL